MITPPYSSPYLRGGWVGLISPASLVGVGEGEGFSVQIIFKSPFLPSPKGEITDKLQKEITRLNL
jgi:hypothetical protein